MSHEATVYTNYKRYGIQYCPDKQAFTLYYDDMGVVMTDVSVALVKKNGSDTAPAEYEKPEVSRICQDSAMGLEVLYRGRRPERQPLKLVFMLNNKGAQLSAASASGDTVVFRGYLRWGNHSQQETMAVNMSRQITDLRCACGPAASIIDNALFDRDTDSAVVFNASGSFRMLYDWEKDAYGFTFETTPGLACSELAVSVVKRVYQERFGVPYKRRNPKATFSSPPAGWMSWYSNQWNTCEETVLGNAKVQAEKLKEYGADTIWIDCEWRLRDTAATSDADMNNFLPDPISYPHGMKTVAGAIRDLGFIPAIWVGMTCDTSINEYLSRYPDSILCQTMTWCGQYFSDLTHPDFLDKLLPAFLRQIKDWGYEAVKWDCLPQTRFEHEKRRDQLHNPGLSTREVMTGAFRKAREVLGDDFYMLYCCALSQRDIDLACDCFDGARIGGDVFSWDEFIRECIDKVYKYYSLHDVVLYCDVDNVILRRQFNTFEQARTRASIVSLLGMPFTIGDDLRDLPDDRIELIRRSLPPLPSHPMDIASGRSDHRTLKINLSVEKPFMRYNVLLAANLLTEAAYVHVDIRQDLHLETDCFYHVYDYWNDRYLGRVQTGFSVELDAYASGVYSIVRESDKPQVISTSRHISQGAADLLDLRYDAETTTLRGRSGVIGGEAYDVVTWSPPSLQTYWVSNRSTSCQVQDLGQGVLKTRFIPEKTGEMEWGIAFWPTLCKTENLPDE